MPQDVNAEFDQLVLELIEHSPVGGVPHTPTHQEALKRLCATHQVYPSAEHKDGFVTARSLAQRPAFFAENLPALISGAIPPEALEPNRSIYDRYVKSLPEKLRARAEALRLTVAGKPALHRSKHDGAVVHDPVHSLLLLPGAGTHAGLPGDYVFGFVHEMSTAAWAVHLHDTGDDVASFGTSSLLEALEKAQELVASAPFHLSELEALGFTIA